MKSTLATALLAVTFLAAPVAAQDRPPIDQRTLADYAPEPYVTLQHAPWTEKAVLHQINTRQFTREGTFRAAMAELPRLKELGVDILWLMPIQTIGEQNRKGTLGSPYSVKDYTAVNPEFGTEADLHAFIDAAHAMGFKVILDWVANHTAWDNAWVTEHSERYERDWKGDFHPTPWWDWSDIIDLDYDEPGVRKAMTEALAYWGREFDVDGYRADVAGYVPIDFWEQARADLNEIKPVFMLAEWKDPELTRKAFDAVYAWDWHQTAKRVAKGEADATAFYGYYSENESAWPKEAMRMTYIANHDSNAWEGTQYENFGAALPAMIALSFTGEGLPTIYNGQEACNSKRLEFFERDPIDWSQAKGCELTDLFRNLIAFRDANPALHNAPWSARMIKVESDQPKQVLSWVRQKDGNKVLGLFNFSDQPVNVGFLSTLQNGTYRDFATGLPTDIDSETKVALAPWHYKLMATAIHGEQQ